MKRLTDDSVMRQIANVVRLPVGAREYKKLVSAGGAVVNHIGEGETRTETATPKMNEVTISLHNIYAYPKTTQEILDFGGVDILGWLTDEISESFVETEETDLTNGTGTKQAKGFLAYPRTTANDKRIAKGKYKGLLTAHGFRSIASTYLNENFTDEPLVIESCLSHVGTDAVRNAYFRGSYLDRRVAIMQAWGDYVEQCKKA